MSEPKTFLGLQSSELNALSGQKFAMLEMKATIAKVLTRFELSVEPDFELVLISELVMKSLHGIKLRLKARVG